MSHQRLPVNRADDLWLVCQVLDHDCRHSCLAIILGRLEDKGRAPASAARICAIRIRGSRRRLYLVRTVVQLCKSLGKVFGVNKGVWRIFEAHLPAVRWARGWRDEEELSSIGKSEVFVAGLDRRRLAKVDFQALAHDSLAIPNRAHCDGSIDIVERDDDAPERLEWRKCVNRRRVCDEVADSLKVLRKEDIGIVEVCEEKRVGWRGRL